MVDDAKDVVVRFLKSWSLDAPLPDERHRSVVEQWQRARAAVVVDYLYVNLSLRGRLKAAEGYVEHSSMMNVIAFYQFM